MTAADRVASRWSCWMRSVVSTSTAMPTFLNIGRVAAWSWSTAADLRPRLSGQSVGPSSRHHRRRRGWRKWNAPSLVVSQRPTCRYPNVIGRHGCSLFISDVDTRYGVDDAPHGGERQHRDQRWSERASAVRAVTGRLVFMVSLIRQFVWWPIGTSIDTLAAAALDELVDRGQRYRTRWSGSARPPSPSRGPLAAAAGPLSPWRAGDRRGRVAFS